MKRILTGFVILPFTLAFSALAMAHPGGHALPGLLGGLVHPLTGLDHLAAMLAVGLWAGSAAHARTWSPVAAFLMFMAGGALLGMTGIDVPGVEAGIAASVLVAGLLVATLTRLPAGAGVALAGVFALFHGAAHGAELPAAASPLLYGLGMLVSTAALLLCGIGLARLAQRTRSVWLLRGAGAMTGGLGAWLLITGWA